jgi:ABC-type glycerol-3-phosphate transport system permease component
MAYAFISLYPILWMFFMSLKTDVEVHTNLLGLHQEFLWEHYLHVLTTTRVPRYTLNSAWISALTVPGSWYLPCWQASLLASLNPRAYSRGIERAI